MLFPKIQSISLLVCQTFNWIVCFKMPTLTFLVKSVCLKKAQLLVIWCFTRQDGENLLRVSSHWSRCLPLQVSRKHSFWMGKDLIWFINVYAIEGEITRIVTIHLPIKKCEWGFVLKAKIRIIQNRKTICMISAYVRGYFCPLS